MTAYALGDIQGCFYSFQDLLDKISFNPQKDQLWLVGDVVNRGLGSYQVLDWCYKNQNSIHPILGNHDLHFLAVAFKQSKLKSTDTFDDILNSANKKKLIDWVLNWPLTHFENNHLMVHAGVIPDWTIDDVMNLSKQVCTNLTGNPEIFFQNMYGNSPNKWNHKLIAQEKNRFIVNTMTRMRCLNKIDGSINYNYKGDLENIPSELKPWFDMPLRHFKGKSILTGHWSAIGIRRHKHGISLDSGCVWGGSLSAYNLANSTITSVKANKKDLV